MTEFKTGDRVRIVRDLSEVIIDTDPEGLGVPAGQPAWRMDGVLLGTVITPGVMNGHVHLEWDADADGGPYEDEYEADRLALIDPVNAHYLAIAAEADRIIGAGSSFLPELVLALWGDISEQVQEWLDDSDGDVDDDTVDELWDTLREGRIEVLIDDIGCFLHSHGFYLDRDADGLHRIVSGPQY